MPTPTRFCVALQTRKSARAGDGRDQRGQADSEDQERHGEGASACAACRRNPSSNPSCNHISISQTPLFGKVRAHVNAPCRPHPIDLEWPPAHALPHFAGFSQKRWPNNGIAPASASWNDDTTLPEASEQTFSANDPIDSFCAFRYRRRRPRARPRAARRPCPPRPARRVWRPRPAGERVRAPHRLRHRRRGGDARTCGADSARRR